VKKIESNISTSKADKQGGNLQTSRRLSNFVFSQQFMRNERATGKGDNSRLKWTKKREERNEKTKQKRRY